VGSVLQAEDYKRNNVSGTHTQRFSHVGHLDARCCQALQKRRYAEQRSASATAFPATFALDTMKHNHINCDAPAVTHQLLLATT
jgi:hypothetical protein